jgi:hypothetical protein
MKNKNVITFPDNCKSHKYYLIHLQFFLQYGKNAGFLIELVPPDDQVFISTDNLIFSCMINGKQIIVDYADHSTRNWKNYYPDSHYFKFQTTEENPRSLIPLGPPMVGIKQKGVKGATIREYLQFRNTFSFNPVTHAILSKQIPNGAAKERRELVQKMLSENLTDVDITANNNQLSFWNMHKECLSAVCVPGATNNMVDRGHMELIGLGVCTISPRLKTLFPYYNTLTPNVHYIECKNDYSDLLDIIDNLKINPKISKEIGDAAREFYNQYYAPKKYWQWILENTQ